MFQVFQVLVKINHLPHDMLFRRQQDEYLSRSLWFGLVRIEVDLERCAANLGLAVTKTSCDQG